MHFSLFLLYVPQLTYDIKKPSLGTLNLKRSYKQIKRSVKLSGLNRAFNTVLLSFASYAEIANKGIEVYTSGAWGLRVVLETTKTDRTKPGPTESFSQWRHYAPVGAKRTKSSQSS